ncbi:spermatogenesis-associated protein 7 [Varanus komodoensis]|uniref:spermatogenesis-associated protein 7 n=1 Tax=Varanus komodoensis TaxID=61221 RepID=UPI001CF76A2D|nr:spermatogenesis-associated protein 7 [Varanus komodoensis]
MAAEGIRVVGGLPLHCSGAFVSCAIPARRCLNGLDCRYSKSAPTDIPKWCTAGHQPQSAGSTITERGARTTKGVTAATRLNIGWERAAKDPRKHLARDVLKPGSTCEEESYALKLSQHAMISIKERQSTKWDDMQDARSRQVIEYQAIPRYGPASPFKGHLSTKSNAFCIDSSSRRLSSQYLIRDHMAVHYNKILSAKAAVDCSVPKSRLNSIKFSDQQRREKLKKEVERCEKEMISSKNVSRSSSRESRRPLSATYKKDSLEAGGNVGPPSQAPSKQKYVLGSVSAAERQNTPLPNNEKPARKPAQKASNISASSSSISTSSMHRLHSKMSCSSSDSIANKCSHKAENTEAKVYSGDLLDKHSEHFTNGQQPFTPRTLKSDAKSFLSQYRYYMPAKRKIRDTPKQQLEAETQTDISSFQVEFEGSGKKDLADFQKIIQEVEDTVSRNADKPDEMKAVSQFSSPRVTSPCSVQSPTMRRIQAEEEELLYLSFIQDITDEILKLGLFSNRALEMLFERHIEQNKNHLDEAKMRHLLEILKVDLGCIKEEPSAGGSDVCGPLQNNQAKHLQLPSATQSQNKLGKSEEFLKAMELIANDSAARCDNFQEEEAQDEISKGINKPASVGLDPTSFMITDETLDTSCTLPSTCNSTTCDADFETSESLREADELRENSLPISASNTP